MRPSNLLLAWLGVLLVITLGSAPVSASTVFDVDAAGRLTRNGSPAVLRGFSSTCMEYLLRGIGTPCLTAYNFNDGSQIISNINRQELDALYGFILPAPSGVVPAIRLTLNAGYYLDVSTPNWAANRAKFPNLSAQYRTLIDSIVQDATSRSVVVILDLHWNDDVTEQQQMALKGSGNANTGDSLTFWNLVSAKFASNPFVWYELYNEPHAPSYDVWLNGNAKFEGMKALAATVRANSIKGMILIAGAFDFAYDATSLIQFSKDASVDRVLFVLHPYMGPLQQGDPGKSATGFATRLEQVLAQTKRPVVVTELGQFCCASEGACFQYPGTFNGESMGYVRAVLTEMQNTQTSWTAWGYRPGTGGDCNQPDSNDGRSLYSSASHNNLGANWVSLFPTFFKGAVSGTAATNSPTVPATKSPTLATKSPTLATSTPTVAGATKSPTVTTKSPTTATKSPTLQTKSPTLQTKSPTSLTASPTVPETEAPTDSPAIQTDATGEESAAPTTSTAQQGSSVDAGTAVGGAIGAIVAVASGWFFVQRRRKNQAMAGGGVMASRNPMYLDNANRYV